MAVDYRREISIYKISSYTGHLAMTTREFMYFLLILIVVVWH